VTRVDLDDIIPDPDQRLRRARTAAAPVETVWDQLHGVTMQALPVTRMLEGLRLLPARLAGARRRPLTGRTFLEVTPLPVLHTEPPRLVISAGLSQAWRPLGGSRPPVLDAEQLRAWTEPGWIKAGMEFRFEPVPGGTRMCTETRVLATDARTRRAFAAYWLLIRPWSAAIRREVLRVLARRAEASARTS
jgi:hypothetical protein